MCIRDSADDVHITLRFVYNIYSTLFMTITAAIVFSQFVYTCSKDNFLESLSSGASETIAFSMVLLKCVIFKWKIKKNIYMLNRVENSWKKVCLRDKWTHMNRIMKETEVLVRRLTCSSCSIMLVTYVVFVGFPLLTDYVNGSETGTNIPMNVWFPFELERCIGRANVYVIECFVLSYITCSMLALVNLYVSVLSLISAEFKILKVDFKNFSDGVSCLRADEMELDNLVSLALKRNVERHQKLLR